MENMFIYNQVRAVPEEAKKKIQAGRLKGMTDINPMWRIKRLTELFGPCGIGWKYQILSSRLETSPTKEVAAFVEIALYIKAEGGWSEPIPGLGGSAFAAQEKSGMHTNDECFKMALTDALSVACKALGVGADVYFESDRSKYAAPPPEGQNPPPSGLVCYRCGKTIIAVESGDKTFTAAQIARRTNKNYGHPLCWDCAQQAAQEAQG